MNIFEKLGAITSDITAVAKNLNVGWGQSSYKAVGEADVLAAVKPIEAKHRVYSYPVDREIVETSVLTSVKKDGSESKQLFMRVKVTYRFVNMDEPSEYVDMIAYGDGVDSQDKAPGKAMTYADKYALMKAYKIITGDDPDQNYSEPLKGKETRKSQSEKAQKDVVNQKIQPVKLTALKKVMTEKGLRDDYVCKMFGIEAIADLTEGQNATLMKNIDKAVERQKAYDEKNGG